MDMGIVSTLWLFRMVASNHFKFQPQLRSSDPIAVLLTPLSVYPSVCGIYPHVHMFICDCILSRKVHHLFYLNSECNGKIT